MSADKSTSVCTLVENDSEGLLPECSIGMEEAQSEDDSSRSTHGNLCMFIY